MSEKKWNTLYDKDNNTELRKLQMIELDIMKIFSEICERNNLRYFLIGGTMLGAVRHKGFIPWDDDMDVGMPRPDYEKFITIVRTELPEGYAFLNYKQDETYKRYFSRIVDCNVLIHNASNTKTIVEEAWLDIFPLDGIPSNPLIKRWHFWSLALLRMLYHASCFEELVNLNRPGRAWYLQMIINFLSVTHFGAKLNTKKILNRIERGLKKYSYDESDYIANFFGAYMFREIVEKRWFGNGKKYTFETLMLNGPVMYGEFLTHIYGDYMSSPKDTDKDKHNIQKIEIGKEEK